MGAKPSFALLAATSVLAATTVSAADSDLTSSKRGLCYVSDTETATEDEAIWVEGDLTWYYNYEASPTAYYDDKLEFVPMLWGVPDSDTDTGFYDTVSALIESGMNISHVLAQNEPDGCTSGGSCIAAETCAEVWINEIEPLKTKYNVSLGAPAVTGSPDGFVWLQNFFTACNGSCSADFIPVHWYGNFEGLASHVGQVNATYPNMTMWVTEFAYADADLTDSETFYNESTSWFDEDLSYLKRYSYFGAFRSDVSNVGADAAMLTQKGKLTNIGAWYLGKEETNNVPKGDAANLAKFTGWLLVVLAACFCTMG